MVYSSSFPIVFLQYGPVSVAMSTSRRVHYGWVRGCLREHGLLKPCFSPNMLAYGVLTWFEEFGR